MSSTSMCYAKSHDITSLDPCHPSLLHLYIWSNIPVHLTLYTHATICPPLHVHTRKPLYVCMPMFITFKPPITYHHAMSPPWLHACYLSGFPLPSPPFALVVSLPFHIWFLLLLPLYFERGTLACDPFSLEIILVLGKEWWGTTDGSPTTTNNNNSHLSKFGHNFKI